ncbi:MAG: hydrolase TatD [Planctomycetaceae bacterium]|nr:hydrolase TatD [Planctomycetaceae bacterium]
MELIDTHCHLDEDAFKDDRDDVVKRALDAGITRMVTIGVTLETSRSAVELASRFPEVFAVVGIQPNYAADAKPGDWDQIVELTQAPKVVAIGETGLDRYWDFAPIETQADYFTRHLRLSREADIPFIVHCREAEDDVVAQLQNEANGSPWNGVMHSFCGDEKTAAACLEMGMHISFAGMLTFKKNDSLRAVAATVPLDRLLVETDSPYLAPVPKRGKRNEPANVLHTAACLAEVHGLPAEEMARITTENARRLFGLD